MALPFTQDPSRAFDLTTLTTFHNPAYDTLLGMILTYGWFCFLVAAGLLFALQRYDPNRDWVTWTKRMFVWALLMFAGPPIVAWVIDYTGGDSEGIPHSIGHFQGKVTTDSDKELKDWARDRYGLLLSVSQVDELQQRTFSGMFEKSSETRPILMNGELIHGLIAADQIVLVNQAGSELAVKR